MNDNQGGTTISFTGTKVVFLCDYLDDWELIQILSVDPPPAAARAFCTVSDIALGSRTRDERDDLLGAALPAARDTPGLSSLV